MGTFLICSKSGRASRRDRWMLALVVLGLGMHEMSNAERPQTCSQWLDFVARTPRQVQAKESPPGSGSTRKIAVYFSEPLDVASMTETEKLKAIECLLQAENDLRPAAFGGATRPEVSQLFVLPVRANLAALYAISWIYNGRYAHADAVALRGKDAMDTETGEYGYVTKASAIHKAYQAYRAWFATVRLTGLTSAQRAGLQPLDGTALYWY